MLRFVISSALVFCLPWLAPAASHRLLTHPNPLTVLSITEGPDGLLWLGATDGLYRFDGFHYHKITSFPLHSARFVAFTSDGSLWCGNFEGLARYHNDRFEILANREVMGLSSHSDRLFTTLSREFFQVGLDGSLSRLAYQARRDQMVDSSGKLWFVCGITKLACWIDPRHPEALHTSPLPIGRMELAQIAPDGSRLWAADVEEAILLENGQESRRLRRMRSQEGSRPGPLLIGRDERLWFLGEAAVSLNSNVEFHDRADHDRFLPLAGFEDKRRHLWIALQGRGLAEWVPDTKWQRWFPEDFAGEPTVQIVRNSQGAAILATQKNLYRYSETSGKWTPLDGSGYRYDSVLPLGDGGYFASIRGLGVARLSAEGQIVERIPHPWPSKEAFQYREILRDPKGRIWVAGKVALMRIEGQPGSLRLREETLPEIQRPENHQAVDVEVDSKGRVWVAYDKGIAWLDDHDQWHKIATDRPIMNLRSIAVTGDDIWVAYRTSGAFSRLHRDGDRWMVMPFRAQEGYGPIDTDFLKRDSRGWIWRGSTEGIYISDGHHFGPADWIHINPGTGLATKEMNQYGFFEDKDGSVWIAGEEGVTHLRPDASWFAAPRDVPPPEVTRVEADGSAFLFPAPLPKKLPAATRILRVDAGSLHAPPFRDYPLRYRLLPVSKEWKLSADGALEFANLPENAYTLELGYSGDGPSAVSSYAFQIGAGGAHLSWVWVIGVLMVSGAMLPMVRHTPGFDLAKFRIEKAVFLLRRRYSHQNFDTPSGPGTNLQDFCGATFSGRYQLSRIVSRGGFSAVYEARDLRDGTARLAVKVLSRGSAQQGWLRDRFAHEVAALRSVDHPGVVRVLDSWISPSGEPCLAMPFLDGPTLRIALREKPFDRERAARLIRQLGAALAEVHAHGIIHRDLKPENLILLRPGTEHEQSVIIDFGTAGLRAAENELAATTLMAGSFHYMAPERLTGHYSPASDVFSFGAMILEALTGKRLSDLNTICADPAFAGELEKTLSAALGAELGRRLASLLAPACDPDPRRRPANVRIWGEQLAEALGQA